MSGYTLPTSRQALACGNRPRALARLPRITGYGIRAQVEYRASSEPVLVEQDSEHETNVYLIMSKFPHLYYLVAIVEGAWRCTAQDAAVAARCIRQAQQYSEAA